MPHLVERAVKGSVELPNGMEGCQTHRTSARSTPAAIRQSQLKDCGVWAPHFTAMLSGRGKRSLNIPTYHSRFQRQNQERVPHQHSPLGFFPIRRVSATRQALRIKIPVVHLACAELEVGGTLFGWQIVSNTSKPLLSTFSKYSNSI